MLENALGTFDVKVTPVAADVGNETGIGRFALDKRFVGDLEGTSRGEMLGFRSAVEGSAGYVAMEKVSGTLHGRSGTFVLQHTGRMARGAPEMSVTVVPDSGTGELVGISGKMNIIITDGKHSYELEYTIT